MPIGISDEHLALAASVRKWAEANDAVGAIRAAEENPAALDGWVARYDELGLSTVAVPESAGGGGGRFLDQAVAIEAAAYALVPGPLLASTARALDPDVALDSTGNRLDLSGAGWTGSSTPAVVALAAAEASGIARWCLDTAVAHAKVREQFGRSIGSFQAVKHLCAEMLETSEVVTAAAWDAARAQDAADEDGGSLAVDVAATLCFDGAVAVAKACLQVLGGIGFTYEHDAHLYLRRALALRAAVGSREVPSAVADAARRGVRRPVRVELDEAEGLREEVRAEVARIAALPVGQRRVALADSGYLAPHWPAPYGLGADAVTQLVIDEELARGGVERPDLVIGAWAAPTILAHGTDAQRERFVGPTLRGEIAWCQLFSEPDAGSDLASLRTRATRVGGGWSLTGQKVWSSLAQRADWGICLARTDPDAEPHAGITYFLVDMRSTGVDVRPLREITGQALFNEVFLDDVLVPDECVVGEVDGGWALARTTLANERVAMAGGSLGESLDLAVALLDEPGGTAWTAEVGRAIALAQAVTLLGARATLRAVAGQGPGPESSVAKLVGVRSRQDAAELAFEMLGAEVLAGSGRADRAQWQVLNTRCLSIAGGTTQVLRNVAAERILGLPRG